MSEDAARSSQFSYAATSNLVLSRQGGAKTVTGAATGEVQSLWGTDAATGKSMGAGLKRAAADKPAVSKKSKKSAQQATELTQTGGGAYTPTTQATKAAYLSLIATLKTVLGSQSTAVMTSAAEEVLELSFTDGLADRQLKISQVLGVTVKKETYALLYKDAKACSDYTAAAATATADSDDDAAIDDMGVAVVFDSDDDEEDGNKSDVENEVLSDADDSDIEDGNIVTTATAGATTAAPAAALSVHHIPVDYISRLLSPHYPADTLPQICSSVHALLNLPDSRAVENKLCVLLGFDKFDTCRTLTVNRTRIFHVTNYRRAGDDAEAMEKAVKEMEGSGEGQEILKELNTTENVSDIVGKSRIDEVVQNRSLEAATLRAINAKNSPTVVGDDEMDLGEGNIFTAKPEATLDLDNLAFKDGARTMTNEKCTLPKESWRAMKPGYEEVHVPAIRSVPGADEAYVKVTGLPKFCQPAFTGMEKLNRLQSKMCDVALKNSENLLLCAPTGAGKTNVAMLTMMQVVSQYLNPDNTVDTKAFKIVYVAPMKALVQEVVKNFGRRLKPFGMTVRELSGDSNLTRQQIMDTSVIVTTPEKWDIITRKSDDRTYTQLVRLVIIDEIHLLHDDRGPVLESLVSRTIRQVEQTLEPVRIVGLSATLPNYRDVATFLRVNPATGLFFFDNSFRPVPLQQQYIGITEKKALKRLQVMNEITYEKCLLQQKSKNQVLIFVTSRAETAKTAKALRDQAVANDEMSYFMRDDSASREIVTEELENVKSADLKETLPYGFAIHHAGLTRSDRELVEDLFADKHIQVLVCTATLAWGVNLPAHSVIIKGTQMYNPEKGRWVELSPLDIMQMLGRAGRPQFDSEGEGIIITNHSELQYYLSLMNLQLPVESQLIKCLPNHLNAEIVLGSITSIDQAVEWLSYSYLFVRMLKSPTLYGVPEGQLETDPSLREHRYNLVHSAASLLEKSQLVRYDRRSGALQSTPLGKTSSHYYISHESMATYNKHLKPTMSDIELLRLFAMSGEFKQIHVRDDEKLELTKLSQKVPIPVKEAVDEPSAKVNILLQAYISHLSLDGFALLADMSHVQQSASRIMRCLFEISLKRGWAELSCLTLNYCKMIAHRTWRSQSPLRQFKNVPDIVTRKLERKDIPFERYIDLKPIDLGELVGAPKMGRTLHKLVSQFPRLELAASVQPITRSMLRVELTITPDFEWDIKVHDYAQLFHVFVEDVDQQRVLHQEQFMLKSDTAAQQHFVTFSVPVLDPLPPNYFVRVVSDTWLHAESCIPISFKNLILPGKLPPPTQLLDLQPLPITTLPSKQIQSLYRALNISHFNPIQSQTFHELYEKDSNALVCAPTGSGKTICAEFAILRSLSVDSSNKTVYIHPKKEGVDIMAANWTERFGKIGVSVGVLTGDAPTDTKIFAASAIVLSTTKNFDSYSRRWKQRKAVQNASLVIFDELHLLGGTDGPTLEVCISRMRYVAAQTESQIRFIGLSASLANANDVGAWMGVKSGGLFNFSPKVRPIPLEIFMQSSDVSNFSSRLLAFGKPLYNGIRRYAGSSSLPSLVFVPSRRQAQLTAIDIMTYVTNGGDDESATSFIKSGSEDMLQKEAATVKEQSLTETLGSGVGFIHSGMTEGDRKKVLMLYKAGVIGVLVCTYDCTWGLDLTAHFVAILGTESYDGKEGRYVDYAISDMLNMMGKAGRPGTDSAAKCLIMCHTPKKEHLKKLLFEPLPVESHLDSFLHDNFCSEICTKVIENQQEALDYLTWSFLYRRLTKNPIYYGLSGTTPQHLSEHLSDIVEVVLGDLGESKCIELDEEEGEVSPLNLGMVGSFYYLTYSTIELVAASVTSKTKTRGIVEILSAATEFGSLGMRHNEDKTLRMMARNLPYTTEAAVWNDPNNKALVLLQSHFERKGMNPDLKQDQKEVLGGSVGILQAIVDVVASNGWLKPALAAMEVSQMVVQGVWSKDSVLKQVPGLSEANIEALKKKGVESPFDILEMEDEDRESCLQGVGEDEMNEVATFCNSYPVVEVGVEVVDAGELSAGGSMRVKVSLAREVDEDDEEEEKRKVGVVCSPLFPEEKMESYWLVLGDVENNKLLAIKRTLLGEKGVVNLDGMAPEEVGDHKLKLFLMSDSYLGVDQEFDVNISVGAAEEDSEEEEE